MSAPTIFAEGLTWPESPRWGRDALWLSDVHNFRLVRISSDGQVESIVEIPGRPAGMDFVSDNELLVASALDRRLQIVRVDAEAPAPEMVADLSTLASANLNDLICHPNGWSIVGDTGFVFGTDEPVRRGKLIAFHRSYGVKIVAEELFFPNGLVVSPDGATLFVAETYGNVITAFDVADDGTLCNRRVHAELPSSPDGLCMDEEGCLWVPMLFEGRFVRAAPSGQVINEIRTPHRHAISCVFGGADRSSLFLGVCDTQTGTAGSPIRRGALLTLELPMHGAGRP